MATATLVPTDSYYPDFTTTRINTKHPTLSFSQTQKYYSLGMPATTIEPDKISSITVNFNIDASSTTAGTFHFGIKAATSYFDNSSVNATTTCEVKAEGTVQSFTIPYTPTIALNKSWYLTLYFEAKSLIVWKVIGDIVSVVLTYDGGSKTISYYKGTGWKNCVPYYFDGSSWKECAPYYFDGSSWKECSTT